MAAKPPAGSKEEKEDDDDEGMTFGRKKGNKAAAEAKEHPFWDHQPMLRLTEKDIKENGPIDGPKDPIKDIRQTPLDLLKEFEWTDTDIDDPAVVKEVYELLNLNYVEDDDNMFRFDYSVDFLKWALKPPHYHIGVRVIKTRKLVAFISAIPVIMRVYDKSMPMVEINFLCVHKKLRKHRLAPILIQEITRRVNVTNVWQAVYTAGVVLPRPVTRSRYWHRSLNPLKLIDVGFSHLGPRMTKARLTRLYRVPEATSTPGLRPLVAADVSVCHKLLEDYLKKFDLVPLLTQEEFAHWMIPRAGVVYSWVVEDPVTKTVTDFVSFYSLPSTVIGNPKYNLLKAAYSYYNVATKWPLKQIINDALVLAKQEGFDVFNCLDIMDNATFLKDLKFGIGDGHLQYYLYNWKCPDMAPAKLGLVLL